MRLVTLLLIAGCSLAGFSHAQVRRSCDTEQYRWEMDKNDPQRLATLNACKEYAAEFNAEVDRRNEIVRKELEHRRSLPDVRIGMTAQQVITKTNLGQPDKINTDETAAGVTEQWVYNHGTYVYFRKGRVTTIQRR